MLLIFSAEKEQTPLQEALNQLIRQLQRCSSDPLMIDLFVYFWAIEPQEQVFFMLL